MGENKVIFCEDFYPTHLSAGEDFSGHKCFQVLVISKNLNGFLKFFQVVSPVFHTIHNHQQFLVMDVIIDFSSDILSGPKGNGVPLLVIMELAKNARNYEIGCIRI